MVARHRQRRRGPTARRADIAARVSRGIRRSHLHRVRRTRTFRPEGHFGGQAGTRFLCVVERADGSTQEVAAKGGQTVVYRGDRVTVQPAGSGGYGDPRERDEKRVDADVADGYISADAAAQVYGRTRETIDAPLEVTAE